MIKKYQIDAFTNDLFKGNPAAVCLLPNWLSDAILQKIAEENNLSDTAFLVNSGNRYSIRWFTPSTEVNLCGHATLATAHVLFTHEGYDEDEIIFTSKSGDLFVKKEQDWILMDFPVDEIEEVKDVKNFKSYFNVKDAVSVYKGKTDYMVVFESEEQIKNLEPDFNKISMLDCRGVIVTAKGNDVDFVSRFFAPQSGINEDAVTGSAHTTLAPYWSGVFGKGTLTANQLSHRGGSLKCSTNGDRVFISGQAKTYSEGYIFI